MVIAEALNEIKDLEKERKQIQSRLLNSLFILPDLTEAERPQPLEAQLESLEELGRKIANLKTAIIYANLTTHVEIPTVDGGTGERLNLMQLIKRIELLRANETLYTSIASHIESKDSRFFSSSRGFMATGAEPVKLQSNFEGTAQSFTAAAVTARKLARQYEQVLVKTNWKTEVAL